MFVPVPIVKSCMNSTANGHGKYAALNNETRDARIPSLRSPQPSPGGRGG